MKILHVVTSLDPAQGGPPAVVTRLAAAQAALGHEVGILAYADPAAAERTARSVAPIPGFDRVAVHSLPPPSRLARFTGSDVRAFLEPRLARGTYLHLHGIWDTLLIHAAKAARRAGVPYALVPHGMLDPWSLAQRALKKKIALRLGFGALIRNASFLHVLNADEDRLVGLLGLNPRTAVIPNGVFLNEIEPLPPRGSFRAKHAALADDPYVLFLSRLHFKKGLDYLADAFAIATKSMPHLRLVVAGPDDGARDPFVQQIARLGLSDRTHVVGPVYGTDKIAAFVDAAAFCLPSRQEGFSVAVTEALACGTPVVISDQCHFPEVAEVGAGCVVPCDASATGAALTRVLSDDDTARRMGEAGARLVRERFTWPKVAELTMQMYTKFAH
ncbi:MAG: glycosyltransferase [Planctomycetota bacterium]|nr:glycosyltransferase [Planctomycetota bacterium]